MIFEFFHILVTGIKLLIFNKHNYYYDIILIKITTLTKKLCSIIQLAINSWILTFL